MTLLRDRLSTDLEAAARLATKRASALGRPVLLRVISRAEAHDPLALFNSAGTDSVCWEQPNASFGFGGSGVAIRCSFSGPDRFRQAERWWKRLVADAVVAGEEEASIPLAIGGFAFDAAAEPEPRWRAFGAASLDVPALLAVHRQGEGWIAVSMLVNPGESSAAVTAKADRLLASRPDPVLAGPAPEISEVSDGHSGWHERANTALQEIRAGRFEKLVLARQAQYTARRPLDVASALTWLRERYADCTVFAVSRGGATFLGATPERLVRLDGRRLAGVCLAGSAPRGASSAEDDFLGAALRADPKELHEHAVVVEAMRAALRPACDALNLVATPQLVKLPNVQHLATPVDGTIRLGESLLSLVERLHPTPAVGGHPRPGVMEAIRRIERFDRGWYAAPIGWIDETGSGEFVVALRSALVCGLGAHLFAGCGLVAESDPARELDETELKLRPMRAALLGLTT